MSTCPKLSGVDLDGKLVKVECIKHDCQQYIQVQGQHPQTGVDISEWDCTDNWQTVMLIENSQQQRQTGAAVESFRNEMAKDNREVLALASQGLLEKH
jgi:hypothetical protein